ncbi:hypothetical protein [Halobacterium zhouii]|uniref:hypothetical protein n=1 Tax=Halobacterium zhouii TaxID=2902624 RepID=UPI001E45D679|nr:hypothetical protein [Halobacterium zhouii]
MTIEVDPLGDEDGVQVSDTVEGEQFDLYTDRAVEPTSVSTDGFEMPVDTAVAIETSELHLPLFTTATFWQDGDVVHRVTSEDDVERLEPARYEVDVSPPAVKLYVRVSDTSVAARYAENHIYLEFGSTVHVELGLRSHHEQPAATVTTTDDPRDLIRAVSTFGSALKTTSPERSWPTLRGHPPALEFGAELDVPAAAEPPDTGVTLELPPEYSAIYTAAPLAFYLGATLVPASTPRLVADGHTREFDRDSFGDGVRNFLQHAFTLDCVIRSAGLYPMRTPASDELDERVDIDYGKLYDLSLAERTAAYLDIPREATRGLLDWHRTVDVDPNPEYAPALPYVLRGLPLVRSPAPARNTRSLTPEPDALRAFYDEHSVARSSSNQTAPRPDSRPVVVPEYTDTPGHAWIAEGFPVGAAKPTVGSYARTLERTASTDPLDIHVVYNDARFRDSEISGYGGHALDETDVRVSENLSTSELRAALAEDTDFLHFVGHVTDAGMVCADGELDTRTVARTGVDAFFLNGCRSYEQGRALLTAGSLGGIVTVDDVTDVEASRVGNAFSLLLDAGFPLYAALDALEATRIDRDRYTILGNDAFALRKSVDGSAVLYSYDTTHIDTDTDPVPATARYYPQAENGLGALITTMYSREEAMLSGWTTRTERLPREQFEQYLENESVPVVVDGELRHTTDLTVEDFQ